jgi:hypothetical protein
MSKREPQTEPTAPAEIDDRHLDVAGGVFPMFQQPLTRNDTLKAKPGNGLTDKPPN